MGVGRVCGGGVNCSRLCVSVAGWVSPCVWRWCELLTAVCVSGGMGVVCVEAMWLLMARCILPCQTGGDFLCVNCV